MARSFIQFFSVQTAVFTMVQAGVLQLIMVVLALAERCTRAVPVQTYPAKKVHVLRRIPASCSNWDKAWAWLTKVDCGTKYRLDYVTVPPREVKQYKLQYVCCDGDTDCKEAENIHSSGFDSTDEKFLAIVLGSTAACVVIIIIIFAITFYTKKTRCLPICDQGGHVYASADGDESQDGQREIEKCPPEDLESDTDQKACEAEYAEIGDARLPRYTDIFKDGMDDREDPFTKASAPPMYSEVTPKHYNNTCVRAPPSLHSSNVDEIQVIQGNSPTPSLGAEDVFEGPRQQGGQVNANNEAKYYNVREQKQKKKKKRSNGSQGSSTASSKGERRGERDNSTSGMSSRTNSRRSKSCMPQAVEMMTKSSSASETIGKTSETSLTKQKRRSAPPDSVDVPIGFIHSHPVSPSSASASGSFSHNTCSVIHEAPASRRSNDKRQKMRSSKDNLQQKPVRKTSRGNDYDNGELPPTPTRNPAKRSSSSYSNEFADVNTTTGSIPPSNGAVLNCCESPSGLASIESESPQPSEKDSLLRTPSCHSGCGSDRTYEDCEHCANYANYDRLHYPSDNDAASLHVYQCLEDVRKEVQELRAKAQGSPRLGTKSDVHINGSILKDTDSISIGSDKKGQPELAHC